jgi:(S)-mandelate dehydrogenase
VNLARSAGMSLDLGRQAAVMSRQMDMSLTWSDLAWVRRHWPGPVIVKGILEAEDARAAVAHGADGIVVSNHGGRQLESAPSALERLPAVMEAAAGRLVVLIDGGVRRGSDIAKAVALGARAVLLGRAPLYGLAARGPRGAAEVLTILRGEFETTLRLLGVPAARRLDATSLCEDHLQRLRML